MHDGVKKDAPYKPLGIRLKSLRQRLQETLVEVSGAVEIDADYLDQIEQGVSRPSEDILELLINHFEIKDEDAKSLWKLAGYDNDNGESVAVLPGDVRIAYTDMLNVIVNDFGVTLQFMQTAGPNHQPLMVSRLGMSKEHAQNIIKLLHRTLNETEPKALPPSSQNNS
jgi:transcriptional regulator with XRE-family HTH domain